MNKMRRLPGPACCRLSEGDHPPEALYELFRDWQRTQTQSSVKALRSGGCRRIWHDLAALVLCRLGTDRKQFSREVKILNGNRAQFFPPQCPVICQCKHRP